jgi:phosphoribosylglycinamide formyltransferase 1
MCRLAIFTTDDDKIVRTILGCKNEKIKPWVVVTNKPDAAVESVAERYGIKYMCFDYRHYSDRVAHEKDIVRYLRKEGISLIIFAHYMRLITKYFVDRFRDKIINVHPSLLPDFKGANGYRDAFDAGVEKSGCTIHYVDEGLDTGDVILQREVLRFEDDDFHTFRTRVHDIECCAIRAFVQSLVV